MKKIFSVLMVLLFVSVSFAGTANHPNKEFGNDLGKDGRSYGDLYLKNKIIFEGATSNGYEGTISVPDVAADYTWTFPSKTGTIAMTSDVSTAATAWEAITDPADNQAIDFTDYYTSFDFGDTDHDMFTIQGTAAFGDVSIVKIEQTTGNATDGTVLEVVSADTDVDALVVTANASNVLSVTGAGALNVIGTTGITGDTTVTGALGATGAVTLGNGTSTVAVNSSVWDVSSAGAFSGVASIAMTGDISFATSKGIKPSTTTAQTMAIQSYDVDGAAYVNSILLTNGNTPALALGSGVETVAVDSTTWDVSTAGVFSGVTGMTFAAGEAATVSLASNGAADDLTISVTGANDASLILQSAGTGADAVKVSASAGSVDIDAAAAKDVTIDGGQVAIASKDNAASAISLTANTGASETIVVTNTKGTGEGAITLTSTAGGVDIDGAAAKDINIASGQVALVSKDDAASAISLTANVGTSETIVVTNTKGTAAGAITATATAGGVDIDAAAAKDVDISGGQVLISSKDNAASAIALTANQGASETIVVTNTQGTDAAAINLTATAGGITAAVATGKAITLNGTTNLKVGSNVASPAGGELDLGDGNYFYITGTNNITSIAAADATAGRMIILRFADILTFTDGNNLKLAGNLATSADDTITLMCDGTNCYEIARSVN
jgi:hypothetical protein